MLRLAACDLKICLHYSYLRKGPAVWFGMWSRCSGESTSSNTVMAKENRIYFTLLYTLCVRSTNGAITAIFQLLNQ